jgi:hypothetical protein
MPNQNSDPSTLNLQYIIDALKIQTDECQEWPFYRNKAGYGCVQYRGKVELAHRVVLMITEPNLFMGTLCALHHCDNPPCFNPRHLYFGTKLDNVRDKFARGRNREARGEEQGLSKLTRAQIIEIRTSPLRNKEIAPLFGVTPENISAIRRRKTWKHIH